MLKANIEAQIEALHQEAYSLKMDIDKIQRLIDGLQKQKEILLSNRRDVLYKIEDLEDQEED